MRPEKRQSALKLGPRIDPKTTKSKALRLVRCCLAGFRNLELRPS